MKQRYDNIRKKFKQIVNEKNKFKEKRSHSFIESNNNYINNEMDNEDSFHLTKNSFYKKEEYNINIILNKKYNVLKKSLDKLQLILQKSINEENNHKNDIIENAHNIKNYYIKELANNTIAINNDLKCIQNEFQDEMKKREDYKNIINNEISNLVKDITNTTNNTLNNPIYKIQYYKNNQQNNFVDINKDMKEQIQEFNLFCNNDMKYSNQKYNIIINDIMSFKDKINISDKKENLNREKFKEEIRFILNSEIDNLHNNEMLNSLDIIKNGKNNFKI